MRDMAGMTIKAMKAVQARRRSRMIREVTGVTTTRRRNTEHETQVRCLRWFSYAFPTLKDLIFAVPNGGLRDAETVRTLKDEGQKNGVSDLILLKRTPRYGALCIEMKTRSGRQRPEQKAFEKACNETGGVKYVICRSLEDFKREVLEYIGTITMEEYTLEADVEIMKEYVREVRREKGKGNK